MSNLVTLNFSDDAYIKAHDLNEDEAERLQLYDLNSGLCHNKVEASAQIKLVLGNIPGANDEEDWMWLVELENGRVAFLRGGCDYTGWDCQSGFAATVEYSDLSSAFSVIGLPIYETNGNRKVREQFLPQVNKYLRNIMQEEIFDELSD